MREILVISGKGGTGKTSLTAAFASLAGEQVICDLDVDAPDLHLLLRPQVRRREEFYSGNEAVVDQARCTACGECASRCRFGAVSPNGEAYAVDPIRCEGCGVCVHFCPEQCIAFPQAHCGQWFISDTRFGPMVHAQLFPGAENSGRLVTLLRQQAKELTEAQGHGLILCDGTPGIGCPVISSLSGVHLAVAVTEPTPSGLHDLARVVELCRGFRTPVAVVLNKADLSAQGAAELEAYCQREDLPLAASLPYDESFASAVVQGLAVTELEGSAAAGMVERAWDRVRQLAGLDDG